MTAIDYFGITWALPTPFQQDNWPPIEMVTIPSARLEALHKVVKAATLVVDSLSTREVCNDRKIFELIQALKGLENGRGN